MSLINENLLQLLKANRTCWPALINEHKERRVDDNSIEENFGSLSFPWDVFCVIKGRC